MGDLNGITVVTIEQALAAPLATGRLAEEGARVIKVERPEGDFARHYDSFVKGHSAYFVWVNAGKESVTLDLKTEADADLLRAILQKADVLIQNLAPGAMSRLGFDAQDLHKEFPHLIICSVSGYGETGPNKNQKAYDLLVQAESGISAVTGVGEELTRVGVSLADIATGMTLYQEVLAALFARERDPDKAGRIVNISLFQSIVDWMNVPWLQHHYGGFTPPNSGLRHPSIVPYGAFTCGDGKQILISIQNEREWASLCAIALGDPSLATHPDYANNEQRVKHRDQVEDVINARFGQFEREAVVNLLDEANIAYGRISTLDDLIDHPQARFREITSASGSIQLFGRGAETAGKVNTPLSLPELGQDNEKIREEFSKKS